MSDSTPDEAGYVARARRDIVEGSLWTAFATVVSAPTSLVVNVLVARSLGAHGLGVYGTYTAIFAIMLALTNLGWSDATVQVVAAATARDDGASRAEAIRSCTGFHLFLSGPVSAACTAWLLASSGLEVALLAGASVWAMQGLGTSTVINTAIARNALAAKIALGVGLLSQAAFVSTAVITHRPAITWAVQLFFLFIAPLFAFIKLQPQDRAAMLAPRLTLKPSGGFWTFALSSCAGGLVATFVYGRSEVLVLRANGLVTGAGLFTVITGLSAQMTSVFDSMLAPLTSIAAGLVALDMGRARSVFGRALRVTSVFGALATVVLVPSGIAAIRILYDARFQSAAGPFAVLALVSSFQTALGPLIAFGFATRSAAKMLVINLASLAIDVTVAFSLVPVFGLWGAVGASAVAQCTSLIWTSRVIGRKLDMGMLEMTRLLRLYVLALVIGIGESAITVRLHGVVVVATAGVVACALGIMWLALRITPGMRLQESDIALLAGRRGSRKLALLVRLLRRVGLAPPQTDRLA